MPSCSEMGDVFSAVASCNLRDVLKGAPSVHRFAVAILLLFRAASAAAQCVGTIAGGGGAVNHGDHATAVSFDAATMLDVDSYGNIYTGDNAHLFRISLDGAIATVAGGGTVDSAGGRVTAGTANGKPEDSVDDFLPAMSVTLLSPRVVRLALDGSVLYLDNNGMRLRKVRLSDGLVQTLVGQASYAGSIADDTPASSARLITAASLFVESTGDILISDSGGNIIKRLSATTGRITFVAGSGSYGFDGDNIPALTAGLTSPLGIVADASAIYFSDGNRIRRVLRANYFISTYAGTGTAGFSGDNFAATAAELNGPVGLAVDISGNL